MELITSKKMLYETLELELSFYNLKLHDIKSRIKMLLKVREQDILGRHIYLLRKCEYFSNTGKFCTE